MSAFGRVEVFAVAAGIGGLLFFLLSPDPSPRQMVATPVNPPTAVPERSVSPRLASQRVKPRRDVEEIPPFEPPIKAVPKPPVVNARYAQMNGLIGESIQLIEAVFNNIYWEARGDNRFEHVNGTVMTLSVESERVVAMRMEFPPDLPSPEMQNAVDYALGRATVSPFYLDQLENAKNTLAGQFKHKDKFEVAYSAGRRVKKGAKKLSGWLVFEIVP
ncbi:MAG: hypothetical protein ACPGQS_12315 [Bradymonadia bacterium]